MTEPVIDSTRRDRHERGSATTWLAGPLEQGERQPWKDAGRVPA